MSPERARDRRERGIITEESSSIGTGTQQLGGIAAVTEIPHE